MLELASYGNRLRYLTILSVAVFERTKNMVKYFGLSL